MNRLVRARIILVRLLVMEEALPEIDTIFWDIGGVLLTNGWDRGSRKAAAETFHLDWRSSPTATTCLSCL